MFNWWIFKIFFIKSISTKNNSISNEYMDTIIYNNTKSYFNIKDV